MKNITITIDLKSLCLGAVGVLCICLLSNFNNADQPRDNAVDEVRRYQAVSGESGIVILDTKTGQYIIEKTTIGQPRWAKGDFATTHNSTARTN
ncbi:hypothetical protein [Spirosoma arcticum]